MICFQWAYDDLLFKPVSKYYQIIAISFYLNIGCQNCSCDASLNSTVSICDMLHSKCQNFSVQFTYFCSLKVSMYKIVGTTVAMKIFWNNNYKNKLNHYKFIYEFFKSYFFCQKYFNFNIFLQRIDIISSFEITFLTFFLNALWKEGIRSIQL